MSIYQDIEKRFTYHKVESPEVENMKALRATARSLAMLILDTVPDSRERSLAITKLEEVVMWANAGIARIKGEPK